jgi:hypothetical protein
LLRRVTMAGIALMVAGCALYVGLIGLVVMFAVGASHNPPLPSPLREVVHFFMQLGVFGFVFVGAGAALLIYGSLQRSRSSDAG